VIFSALAQISEVCVPATIRLAVLALALAVPAARAAPPPAAGAPAAAPVAPQQPQAPAAEDAAAAQEKTAAAIREAFGRELDPLGEVAFETPGGVSGKVEAKDAPEVKAGQGSEELVISLGLEQRVSCTVVAERLDAAAVTWRMVESVRKNLKLIGARPVEVLAVAGSPLVFSDIVYQADSEKGPIVGQLKVAVYAHDAHSLLCHHDQPGYARTFQRVIGALAAGMKSATEDERKGARYAEIAVVRVAGMPVGYAEQVVWDRKGGGRVTASYESQILPRSPTELASVDAFKEEESDANGLLLAGSYVHVANGTIDSRIRVSKEKDEKSFRYEGEKQGKPLEGRFKTKAGLATDHWFARRFDAKAGYGPKAEVRHEGYSFAANPAGAITVAYKKDAARARHAEMSLGPMRLSGELDENGFFKSAEIPIGAAKLVIERAWSRGAP